MRKFHALYINEMIKISRKIVVIIIFAAMVLGMVLVGGVMKLSEVNQNRYVSDNGSKEPGSAKGEMQGMLDYYKAELEAAKTRYEDAASPEEKTKIGSEIKNLESQVAVYQLAVDKDINLNGGGYRSHALSELNIIGNQLALYSDIPESELLPEQKAMIAELKALQAEYNRVIDEKNYSLYIQMQNRIIDADAALTDDEKKVKKESNALRLKVNPTGEIGENVYNDPLSNPLSTIESLKLSLIYNIDYTNYSSVKPLTPASRQDLVNSLATEVYKVENGFYSKAASTGENFKDISIMGMVGYGIFMLVVMILILAGGAVSQEISSGSIKSLIISPTKRYKIFFAKLASLFTVGVAGALLLYCFSILINGVMFGFSGGTPFIYAINGVAHEINFFLYRFLYVGISFIDVIVYMVFAYMLSIITRNTAASVGISIAIYFGGSLVNSFLQVISTGEWAKFIPFNNMSLAGRILPDITSGGGIMNLFGFRAVVPSVGFSLAYLAVMLICFGYIALDSFNRRDIK
ncbi:MAG: ABC transporter permease subunit [Saccharofermentanales bacterium]